MGSKTNAERQREYRDRKKQGTTPQHTPGGVAPNAGTVTPPGGIDETLNVNVKVDETAPKPPASFKSFIDRITGGQNQPPPVKKTNRPKKQSENLISSTMPTVVVAFVVTYSQNLVHAPYKPCAPSKEEVSGIIGPLMEILAREVEVTGKASQNTIDLINSLLCAMMYGLRAYITYVQIKSMEYPANGTNPSVNDNRSTGLGSYPDSTLRPVGYSTGYTEQSKATDTTASNGVNSHDDTTPGDSEGRNPEAELFANMFKRDREGRKQLGLLPTTV